MRMYIIINIFKKRYLIIFFCKTIFQKQAEKSKWIYNALFEKQSIIWSICKIGSQQDSSSNQLFRSVSCWKRRNLAELCYSQANTWQEISILAQFPTYPSYVIQSLLLILFVLSVKRISFLSIKLWFVQFEKIKFTFC